jgi:hypothetical protein
MLGRANASREWLGGGGSFESLFTSSRVDAVILQEGAPAGKPLATWAAQIAQCREWLSEINNSPEGLTVTTRISYGCWPTNFKK